MYHWYLWKVVQNNVKISESVAMRLINLIVCEKKTWDKKKLTLYLQIR